MPTFLEGVQKKIGTEALNLAGYIGGSNEHEDRYSKKELRTTPATAPNNPDII